MSEETTRPKPLRPRNPRGCATPGASSPRSPTARTAGLVGPPRSTSSRRRPRRATRSSASSSSPTTRTIPPSGARTSPAVRRVSSHGRHGPHALGRQRGDAPHAHHARSAHRPSRSRARRGPRLKHHVGRLRLRRRLPRRARPRLHARRPDLHRAPAGGEAAGHLHALPRLDLRGRTRSSATATSPRASRRSTTCPTPRRRKDVQHPVACIDCHDPADDGAARDAARLHRGHPQALKAPAGRPNYDPNRDASTRRCARTCAASATSSTTSRAREAPHLPVVQRPAGRRHPRVLRARRAQGLDAQASPARACSRRSTPSSRCGTRASTRRRASPAPTATCPTAARAPQKVSDHHVRSPLLNIASACQTCHRVSEGELRDRVDRSRRAPMDHA
jgi:hypothetical protein